MAVSPTCLLPPLFSLTLVSRRLHFSTAASPPLLPRHLLLRLPLPRLPPPGLLPTPGLLPPPSHLPPPGLLPPPAPCPSVGLPAAGPLLSAELPATGPGESGEARDAEPLRAGEVAWRGGDGGEVGRWWRCGWRRDLIQVAGVRRI